MGKNLKNVLRKISGVIITSILILNPVYLNLVTTVSANPLPYIDYQGRLSDSNGNLLTGNYYITFCIYSVSSPATNCTPPASPSGSGGTISTLGSAVWGEYRYFSSTNSPSNEVLNGVFNTHLGSQSALPTNLFSANSDLYLGLNVYNGSSWDGQMTPLEEIVSSGYSIASGGLTSGTSTYSASQTPAANQIPILDSSGNLTLPANLNVTAGNTTFGGGTNVTSTGNLTIGGTNSLYFDTTNFSIYSNGTNLYIGHGMSSTSYLYLDGNIDYIENGDLTVNGLSNYINGNVLTTGGYLNMKKIANPTAAPTLGEVSTVGLPAATYYVEYTWVNGAGETGSSPEASYTTGIGYGLTVSTTFSGTVTSANIYVSTTSGSETLQTNPITVSGGTWTEPNTGITNTGAAAPVTSTAGGYITLYNTTGNGSSKIFSTRNGFNFVTTTNYWYFTGIGTNGDTFNMDAISGNINLNAGSYTYNINSGGVVINSPSGYAGDLLDVKNNGTTEIAVANGGNVTITNNLTVNGVTTLSTTNTGNLATTGSFHFSGQGSNTCIVTSNYVYTYASTNSTVNVMTCAITMSTTNPLLVTFRANYIESSVTYADDTFWFCVDGTSSNCTEETMYSNGSSTYNTATPTISETYTNVAAGAHTIYLEMLGGNATSGTSTVYANLQMQVMEL